MWKDTLPLIEVGREELVTEFALRIVLLDQGFEIREARIQGVKMSGLHGEELCPVWPGAEGLQSGLDLGKDGLHGGPFRLPCEMNSERPTLVRHAHPQIVSFDGAEFRDEEMRRDLIAKSFHRTDRFIASIQGDEVLGLQFLAA